MKAIFFSLLLVCAVLAQSSNDYIEKGKKAYNEFKLEKSVEYFEIAYKNNPSDYEAMINLSRAYNAAGDEAQYLGNEDKSEFFIKKALDLSEKIVKAFPDSGAAHAYLSLSYGNYAEHVGGKERIKMAKRIEQSSKKAIKLKPDFYLPYVILGIYYRKLASLSWLEKAFANTFFGSLPDGTFEDSRVMLEKALSIDPNIMIAVYNLSRTYRELDNEAKEKELLVRASKIPIRDFRDKYTLPKVKERLSELD